MVHFIILKDSWVKKLTERVYNVEKGRKREAEDSLEESTPKKRGRPKRVISLESRYPSFPPVEVDETTQEQHTKAISKEMEKDKPRKEILLPLMKSTFHARRQYILDNGDSVLMKLEKFPPLKMPPLVS